MVLVDSSVWIEAFRRKGRLEVKLALESLLDAYEAQWCSPIRLEVLGGARAEDRSRLGRHFAVVPYRSCTEQDWDRAVALAWKLRDRGVTVPRCDVIIAALALADQVRLYTLDAHFSRIAEITGLRLYTPGYSGMFVPDEDA
jgi:predicted nucleic acid-binding protein